MKKLTRYKNIINKSKSVGSKPTSYDLFVNSLPKELDYYKNKDNYRLEAAWKAYGKPSNLYEAYFNGLVDVIGDKAIMPSIGYDEETGNYEYLNVGKENDSVNKDIRVWENETIPFVKELKNGGYIRTFDEEQNCWMYTKNAQPIEENVEENVEAFKQGGNIIPEGALHARKNNMEEAEEGLVTPKGIPVVTADGKEQVAEVEKEEITFSKPVTEKLEDLYKKFYDESTSEEEKNELAIKCGKFITKEILFNTDDRVGLIEKIKKQEGL